MYILKNDKKFKDLSVVQQKIKQSKEMKDFFDLLNVNEVMMLQKQQNLLSYQAVFGQGIYKEPVFFVHVMQSGAIASSACILCQNDHYCHHIQQLCEDIENQNAEMMKQDNWQEERKAYIQFKVNEELERREQERIERLRSESKAQVAPLLNHLMELDKPKLASKVTLEPTLDFVRTHNGLYSSVQLRVGIDKMYKVRDLVRFFQMVTNDTEQSYGKNLIFKHGLENFTKESQELIRIIRYSRRADDPYNPVSHHFPNFYGISLEGAHQIIQLFQGKAISISGIADQKDPTDYFVRLEPKEISFLLNDQYVLSIEGLEDEALLDLPKASFCIQNGIIDEVLFSSERAMRLYDFIRVKPKFSFKHIKDTLKNDVISRLHKEVKIAQPLQEEFAFKEIEIEAYFTLTETGLQVETHLKQDGHEISKADVTDDRLFVPKYNQYESILSSLGFVDGKLVDISKEFYFYKADLSSLKEVATVYLSEQIARVQAKTYKPKTMNLGYQTGLLSVALEPSEYTDEELYKILRALKKKARFVRLKSNVILEVDEEAGRKFLATVEDLGLDARALTKEQKVPLYQLLQIEESKDDYLENVQTEPLRNLLHEIGNYKNAEFEVPSFLKGKLRNYQVEAFRWMKVLIKHGFHGVLADDMGLGKTLEMIAVICSDEEQKPSLIVCPKSLCYNWKNEFELWAPQEEVTILMGLASERQTLIDAMDTSKRAMYITSYDSLKQDLDFYKNKDFKFMILDESQFIKNHDTIKAQAVKQIDASIRFALTGTPIENTIVDLWSIFDFLMPGYLGTITSFKSKYERSIIEKKDEKSISSLVHKIAPFVLRRTKEEVIHDLPDKIQTIHVAKMTSSQQKIYDAELLRTRNMLESSENKFELLACITRLRQICVDPGLFVDGYDGGSGKIELTMELIEDYIANSHRILLFSQFASIFGKLEDELSKRGITYSVITGKTSSEQRVQMATEFNQSDEVKVFLVSLKAGGTGLNLVGADIVIHLDPWWNVAVEEQATDRAHRLGQVRTVNVIKLVSEGSIEQKVIELQEKKKEIAKLIVADDDANIQKLSKDDLGYLLRG